MAHSNYAEAIMYLFPNADSTSDFIVRDDGEGQFIAVWNLNQPQPSHEELDIAYLQVVKNNKVSEFNKLCNKIILEGFRSPSTGYYYGFSELDQMNMTQQMLLFLNNPLLLTVDWKTEDAGIIRHSKTQFLTIVQEADSHKRGWISYYWKKKNEIMNKLTVEEVLDIIW